MNLIDVRFTERKNGAKPNTKVVANKEDLLIDVLRQGIEQLIDNGNAFDDTKIALDRVKLITCKGVQLKHILSNMGATLLLINSRVSPILTRGTYVHFLLLSSTISKLIYYCFVDSFRINQ